MKSLLAYLIFGVLTTAINMVVFGVCYEIVGLPNVLSTILAWFLAVAFAFITNKRYVFRSLSMERRVLFREIATFFGCRLLTGLLDVVIMFIAVDLYHRPALIWKLLSNIVVIILNYAASRLIIFKPKDEQKS